MFDDRSSRLVSQFLLTFVVLLLTFVTLWSIPGITKKSWLHLLLIPTMLLGVHFRNRLGGYGRTALVGLMLTCTVVYSFDSIYLIRANIAQPPEFDIQQFWLNGRIAVEGLNFYESEHALKLAQQFHPSEAMISELHFWYPPPTMFLFWPLGWFEIHTATLLWYVTHTAILIACIFLLWRLFLKKSGWMGLVLAATLVMMLHPTLTTVMYGQLNFIILLMLLLFWQDRQHMRAGIWLALAIFTKPYMAMMLLYVILQRKWRILAGAFLTMAVSSVLALIIFGPTTFFSYFTMNPATTSTNNLTVAGAVSLMGLLSRIFTSDNTTLFTHPAYIVPSLILTIISGWLIYRLGTQYEDLALALILPLALLLYPISGEHYCIVLLIPMLFLWVRRQEIIGGAWGVSLFIALEYTTFRYHAYQDGWSNIVSCAILLNWLILAIIGYWVLTHQANQSHIRTVYV